MKSKLNLPLFLVCLAGLIAVRGVEDRLFYDPFLNYFRLEGRVAYPGFRWLPLIFSHLLRYGLNLIFSCEIVYALFKRRSYTIQTAVLLLGVLLIFFPLYLWSISTEMRLGHLFTFYIRRFLIQPVLLLILIPVFYFEQRKLKEKA